MKKKDEGIEKQPKRKFDKKNVKYKFSPYI